MVTNIICNNCVGARIYRNNNIKYPNPFIWNSIFVDDFINLMENYNSIHLDNVIFSLENYKMQDKLSVIATLDDFINLHFIHYIKDETKEVPFRQGINIYYNNILDYAKNKWYDRINRTSESPLFYIHLTIVIQSILMNIKSLFLNY